MIHYHGMPVSGDFEQSTKFSKNRHVLISYSYPAPIEWVSETCSSFCLDNGAFALWSKKKVVNWDDYAAWVAKWSRHPRYDWCLIPDIIDGTEEDNKRLVLKYAKVLKNAVPVWHMHESLEYLDKLCGYFPRVALGSSGEWRHPGTDEWWVRMGEALAVACDSDGYPRTRLHGLRMLNPKVFVRMPLTSADSCNAGVNAGSKKRFGPYMPKDAHMRASIIASHTESFNSSPTWERPVPAGRRDESKEEQK